MNSKDIFAFGSFQFEELVFKLKPTVKFLSVCFLYNKITIGIKLQCFFCLKTFTLNDEVICYFEVSFVFCFSSVYQNRLIQISQNNMFTLEVSYAEIRSIVYYL
jgi:hypothetical protein